MPFSVHFNRLRKGMRETAREFTVRSESAHHSEKIAEINSMICIELQLMLSLSNIGLRLAERLCDPEGRKEDWRM